MADAAKPYVIVGAGLAGFLAAEAIRAEAPGHPLLMMTADAGDYYRKPMLSFAFDQDKTADDLLLSTRAEMMARLSMLFGGLGGRRGGGGGGWNDRASGSGDPPSPGGNPCTGGYLSGPRVSGRSHGSPELQKSLGPGRDAVEKLETEAHSKPMKVNEAVSHLFIVNPLSGFSATMFSTHPPMQKRISRLKEMRGY